MIAPLWSTHCVMSIRAIIIRTREKLFADPECENLATGSLTSKQQRPSSELGNSTRSYCSTKRTLMPAIDSLNWTAAPLLLHSGITSRPS